MYSESSQTSKMELSAVNYSRKTLHRKCMTRFWIRQWIWMKWSNGDWFPQFWYYWNGLFWLKFSSFRGRTKISSCRTINHLHRITENLMFCFSPGTMPTRNYKLRPFLLSIYEFSSNNSWDLKLKIKDRKHLTLQPMVYERYN